MKKTVLITALLLSFFFGNAQKNLWNKTDLAALSGRETADRIAMPFAYSLFSLNQAEFKQLLATAPLRGSGQVSGVIISFPDGTGTLQQYRIYEAPVLQPGLAAIHTDMRSYTGQGIDTPVATVRFSITRYGLHAMVLSPKGTVYIDPYTKNGDAYIAYRKADLFEDRSFNCEVANGNVNPHRFGPSQQAPAANDGVLRTYRLALACTTEYAAYHINAAGLGSATDEEKKAAVLAAMVVSVTRVNAVYEREVAVTLQLVDNNQDIIFIDTDDFSNSNAGSLINESQTVINNIIGSANYDVGHTASTGGGGLAQLGSICGSGKARGVTGLPAPVGDSYDIDYLAHELGHQFGGNHIFNGLGGSCGGNYNNTTSVEPGSGTTIMGYAGICGAADVQQHSDPYFNAITLAEIFSVLNGTSCAVETDLNNDAPVLATLTAKTIPYGTAFVLKGNTATDAQGDALTYCWEQTDGVTNNDAHANQPNSGAVQGPNYRSLPPSENKDRYLPQFSDVLEGNLYPTWEITPDVARALNFALTVRDNNVNGGQTARRNMTVNVTDAAGPFMVTSQAEEGVTWIPGEQETITWDVAGTSANGINAANVNILLSTNGGQSFDVVLAANTANDGDFTFTVPNIFAPFCRIMVEAADNIFYALNPIDFSVGYYVTNDCINYTGTGGIAIPDNNTAFTTSDLVVGEGSSVSSVTVRVNAAHNYVSDLTFKFVNPSGTEVVLWQNQCGGNNNLNIKFDDSGNPVSCGNPTQGTLLPVGSLADFIGESAVGTWQLAFSDNQSSDVGTLNSWSAEICSYVFTPAAVAGFGLKDFRIYPNPNTGSFTVAFASASQNPISVSVYDMRGRQVFAKGYANTGLFSSNVSLQGAAQGVYMVTVEDGNRKETRKIVVN